MQSNEGSSEPAHMRRLARAFAAPLHTQNLAVDKDLDQNLNIESPGQHGHVKWGVCAYEPHMGWPIFVSSEMQQLWNNFSVFHMWTILRKFQ